jgi:hypothetical protein
MERGTVLKLAGEAEFTAVWNGLAHTLYTLDIPINVAKRDIARKAFMCNPG